MKKKQVNKSEIVKHFYNTRGHNKFGSYWVKIIKAGLNGNWGPQNRPAHTFRSGVCIGFFKNKWIEDCFNDESCQVYPRVGDVKDEKKISVYADDTRSKEGQVYRDWYKKDKVEEMIVELQLKEDNIKKLEEEKERVLQEIFEKEKSVVTKKKGRPRKSKE